MRFTALAIIVAVLYSPVAATAQDGLAVPRSTRDHVHPVESAMTKLETQWRRPAASRAGRYPGQDGVLDGLIIGAIVGVALAWRIDSELDADATFGWRDWGLIAGIGAASGAITDSMHSYQGPIRLPANSPPQAKVKVAFRF
jgi:hypothetical protein